MPVIKLRQRGFVVCVERSKCKLVVPGYDHLLRCAVEQASLDASVQSIWQCHIADEIIQRLFPHRVILDRIDGEFLLSVSARRQQRTEAENSCLARTLRDRGLQLLERDAVDIQTEPFFSNTRVVWSFHRYHVSLLDRLRFSVALAEDQPLSIINLEARARPSCNTLAAVCALACAGLLQLSLDDSPIGPHTAVSVRRSER